jgi:hypothetical protein
MPRHDDDFAFLRSRCLDRLGGGLVGRLRAVLLRARLRGRLAMCRCGNDQCNTREKSDMDRSEPGRALAYRCSHRNPLE